MDQCYLSGCLLTRLNRHIYNSILNTGHIITNTFTTETRVLKLALVFTLICLISGLVAPLLTLKKLVVFENTFSIYSGTLQLLQEGHFFLFLLIASFSIVLPFLKIAILFSLLSMQNFSSTRLDQFLHWIHLYGKWSMLDVFVVAILVVSVKLGALASVEIRYGLYFFTTAVLFTMIITARVVKLAETIKANTLESESNGQTKN